MRKFTKESTTHFVKGPVCRWSEYVRKNNEFLHKQLENQNSVGEPLSRACTGSLGEKLDES